MSAKAKTTNGSATPKKPRKPKGPPMPFDMRFALMNMVKTADPSTPDATLAAQGSELVGRKVQQATISAYRKKFGIPNVRKPGVGSLYQRIAKLERYIVDAGYEVPA